MVFRHLCLPVKKDLLQFSKVRRHQDPFLVSHEVHFQMVKIKYHR